MSDPAVVPPGVGVGWLAREVAEELPQLQLLFAEARLPARTAPLAASPPGVRERLGDISSRINGVRAIHLRREQVPAAYRVFYRQIGLDPDVRRTPVEDAARERMIDGAFLSRGLLPDVLLIALMDTGVPVWAVDAEAVDGPLGIRLSRDGEPLGRAHGAERLDAGRLVVADASSALAVLFGAPACGHRVDGRCRRLLIYALQVAGVPSMSVAEALWWCSSALAAAKG